MNYCNIFSQPVRLRKIVKHRINQLCDTKQNNVSLHLLIKLEGIHFLLPYAFFFYFSSFILILKPSEFIFLSCISGILKSSVSNWIILYLICLKITFFYPHAMACSQYLNASTYSNMLFFSLCLLQAIEVMMGIDNHCVTQCLDS